MASSEAKVKISADLSQLEDVTKKAQQLKQVLLEAKQLIAELNGTEVLINLQAQSFR